MAGKRSTPTTASIFEQVTIATGSETDQRLSHLVAFLEFGLSRRNVKLQIDNVDFHLAQALKIYIKSTYIDSTSLDTLVTSFGAFFVRILQRP